MQTPHEADDANKVEEAVDALQTGSLTQARRLLEEVIANTPHNYVHQYEEGDAVAIKFWDLTDFGHYLARMQQAGTKRSVVWKCCAYPRAHYYLACLEIKLGNFDRALGLLNSGYKLEPNVQFLIERAQTLLRGHSDRPGALACYQEVLDRGDDVPTRKRAVALRGKGFVSTEMGKLDEAERYFKESLTLDPHSPVAANELQYISNLRSTGRKTLTEVVATEVQAPRCSKCGGPIEKGQVAMRDGRTVLVCEACLSQAVAVPLPTPAASTAPVKKRWWEFWK